MRERDGISHRDAWIVFDWANKDSFWATNVMSPSKLRESFAQLQAKAKLSKPQQPSQNAKPDYAEMQKQQDAAAEAQLKSLMESLKS